MVGTKVCNGEHLYRKEGYKGCQGLCMPLISDHNPVASEWYCAKCNTSYLMSGDEFKFFSSRRPKNKNDG